MMSRPSPPPSDSRPALFAEGELVYLSCGDEQLEVARLTSAVAEGLLSGLEALLQTRSWPAGVHRWPLDPTGDRQLEIRAEDGGLELRLLDRAGHLVLAGTLDGYGALAGQIEAVAQATSAGDDAALAARLTQWARAVDRGDRPAAAPPPGQWPVIPAMQQRGDGRRLPVSGLHHLAWRRAWRHEAPGLHRVSADADTLRVFDRDGLVALGRVDGVVRWRRPSLVPLGESGAFAFDGDGALIALAPDGLTVWSASLDLEAPIDRLVETDDCIVIGGDDHIQALDRRTGRVCWTHRTHFGSVHGLTVHGPLAWLAADDGFLQAIRLADGQPHFTANLGMLPEVGPLLHPAGIIMGGMRAPEPQGEIVCFDPITGRRRWTRRFDGLLLDLRLAGDDALIAAIDGDSRMRIVELRASTGAVRWRQRLPVAVARVHPTPELRLVKTADSALHALSAQDGRLRWQIAADDPDQSLIGNTPPVRCRGLLLVPGSAVRAIDPESGRLVQTLDCGELVPDWMHAWPEGDLAIAEDDAVVRYLLGGHLALVA